MRLRTGSRPQRNRKGEIMIDWFVQTLRSYPEIAIFLSLALGYYFGSFTYKGLGLGAVTATLIAAVIIGQLGIKIGSPLKPFFFLMFLFAIGYGVGPQFVRGIAQGRTSAGAVCRCGVPLLSRHPPIWAPDWRAMTSAPRPGSMPDRRRSRRRWGWRPMRSTASACRPRRPRSCSTRCRSPMPSPTSSARSARHIVLALLGPALLGIDLEAACKRYEEKHGGKKEAGGPGTAWHQFELRAFRVKERGPVVGKTVQQAEAMLPDAARLRPAYSARRPDHGGHGRHRDPAPVTSWPSPGGARCW